MQRVHGQMYMQKLQEAKVTVHKRQFTDPDALVDGSSSSIPKRAKKEMRQQTLTATANQKGIAKEHMRKLVVDHI